MKISSYRVFIIGVIMGLGAALVQAYFKVQPPEAYGISFIGHPNDLFAWLTNRVIGTNWPIRDAFIVYPVLTVAGVFIGSFIAARRKKEFAFQPGPVRKRFLAIIFGFLVANLGLLWGSCPIRTALLVSYGSGTALIALASIAIGVVLAIIYIRFKAKKGVPQ
ncbi:MAG: YeeE/YedE family protein [Dehalococcoidales bacterium]|nr:YeeE/YedE family protein [Dehalococcoidales bacterium]